MSPEKHKHTIGTIGDGQRMLDVDWPFDHDDDTERDPAVAFLFDSHGREVAEIAPPFGEEFIHESQVMTAAKIAIENGEIDE